MVTLCIYANNIMLPEGAIHILYRDNFASYLLLYVHVHLFSENNS